MTQKTLFTCCLGLSLILKAQAQLAITEVMSGESDKNHPDWFELHNYGTNDMDLTGYSWNDDAHGGFAGADTGPFDGIIIHSNETIFVMEQKGITDATGFTNWWGLGNNPQVVVLNAADPGLSANPLESGVNRADSVRLWRTNLAALGSNTNGLDLDECPEYLVQRVDLGETTNQSLTFNSNSGTYNNVSIADVDGAFLSNNGETGSPGVVPDAIRATMAQKPADQVAVVGDTITFTNGGIALPALTFQWYFNGTPINSQTPGVSVAHVTAGMDNSITNDITVLTLNNVQTTNSGTYTVVANNGLKSFTNSAQLTVNASPTPPQIVAYTPALDKPFDAYVNQAIGFGVTASGYPAPTYQWYKDNAQVPSETSDTFSLALTDTNQTGVYSVVVTNASGRTNISFTVNVTPKPNLAVTEVMSSEGTNTSNGDVSGHNDWFELSNLGDFPVNLYGFRVDDSHDNLSASTMIGDSIIIHPSESVVFVQDMTADQFRTWWGTNLPVNVQIIDYNGAGQGFSGNGDAVHVWNAVAQAGDEVAYGIFSAGTDGTTFGFDLNYLDMSGFDGVTLTTAGVNGAFVAAVGGDAGSPGALVNLPRFVTTTPVAGGFALSWVAQPNWKYTIQYKTDLTQSAWTTLTQVTSGTDATMNYTDYTTDAQRFYRVFLNLNNQ